MTKIAIDFGTGNTVLACWNETLDRAETIEIPEITTKMKYRLRSDQPERTVHVIPSMIHYGKDRLFLGDQVLSQGLADHHDTFRWMKRGVATRASRRRRTAQGHKSAVQAATDFLTTVLNYASDQIDLARDEFTFTAPTEAFEDFQDWLRTVAETAGIQRMRILDEPTACVLGYQGVARKDDRFLVFDFGCGTLDVVVVRVDLASTDERKAVQLGQAGCDLGGMNIDQWIADDFRRRHQWSEADTRKYEALLYRRAEETKIQLSDPQEPESDMTLPARIQGRPRVFKTAYSRSCQGCQSGEPSTNGEPDSSCLGCLLLEPLDGERPFPQRVRETIETALEDAAVKAGTRKGDITRVLVTGGTSLVPAVRKILTGVFDSERVRLRNPFDAVARGACRGAVAPVLQHDYAIESYDDQRKRYVFEPLFAKGTEFPTDPKEPEELVCCGSYDGQTRVALRVYEVSSVRQRSLGTSIIDDDGALLDETEVRTDHRYICLNRENPTFIVADPPFNRVRDEERLICSFRVDGHRRLLVTVRDTVAGRLLLDDHPVVRL